MQAVPEKKEEHCAWCHAPILTHGAPIADLADPTKVFCSLAHLYYNYLTNGPFTDFDEMVMLPLFTITGISMDVQVQLLQAMDEWMLLMARFKTEVHNWYDCFFEFICRKYQVEPWRYILTVLLAYTDMLAYNPLEPIFKRPRVLSLH